MKSNQRTAIKRFNKSLLTHSVLVASLAPMSALASGIFLQEAVVANAGTVGAGDGVYTQSAAAQWTNPATMSHMGERQTTLNMSVFDLEMKYKHDGIGKEALDGKASTVAPTIGIFHAHQINEQIHLGIAAGVAGGSALDYGTRWAGSALLNDIDLAVAQVNPTIAYKMNDQWSFGAGVQMSWASLSKPCFLGKQQWKTRLIGRSVITLV